jgi:hypothetical protein
MIRLNLQRVAKGLEEGVNWEYNSDDGYWPHCFDYLRRVISFLAYILPYQC